MCVTKSVLVKNVALIHLFAAILEMVTAWELGYDFGVGWWVSF